jgi:uncharacterized protein (PEP-CTERM system associated)
MTRRRAEPRCLAFALAAWAVLAQAQEGGGGTASGGTTLTPRLGLTQTWTDNLRLNDQNKDAALITTVSPGISLVSNSGALRGTLDYSLNGIAYLKSDQPSRIQNSLSANLQAELISRTFFVDVRASIGQQNNSAFGAQSAPTLGSQSSATNLANANQHETATLAVSPSLRGMLGGAATYDLRGDFTRTEVRGSSLGDSHGTGGSLLISEWNAGVLGWWLQANSQRVKSSAATSTSNQNDALKAGLNYRPDPDWYFTANAGAERNNYQGAGNANGPTSGVTAQWTPTERTRVGANWQHHNYGNTHGLNFEHRLARSVWSFSDTQSVMLGNTGSSGGGGTIYDQFFLLFASIEPDVIKRDTLVRAYLQSQGLSPDAAVAGGFLSTGPSRLRSQMLNVTLQGVRSSVSVQVSRSLTTRLGSNQNEGDLANTSRVEQRSYSLTASHQLTPLSSLALTASRQETTGDSSAQSVQLTSLLANWNVRLGLRLSGQLGVRRSRFEGATPYTENAVYANLTQQF